MLEIRQVTKRFDGLKILDDLSLSLAEGTITGLLGPNGAGKTTLLRCALGIMRLEGGEILFKGVNIHACPEVKQRIGYIAERPLYCSDYSTQDMASFYRWTYDNWDEKRFCSLMDFFAVQKKQKMKDLSRGKSLLAAFALNLSLSPKLLVLDEPFSGIDPIMRQEVLRLILGQVAEEGTAVLITSHNTSDLERICDNVALLRNGKIILSGSLEFLKGNTIKLQAVFPGDLPEAVKTSPVLLGATRCGAAYTLVGRPDLYTLCQHHGAQAIESGEITLEEIYIHHMGGAKNDITA